MPVYYIQVMILLVSEFVESMFCLQYVTEFVLMVSVLMCVADCRCHRGKLIPPQILLCLERFVCSNVCCLHVYVSVTSVHTSACFFHHSIYDQVASKAQQPMAFFLFFSCKKKKKLSEKRREVSLY